MQKRNLGYLTNHIFEAIQMLKDGDMDVETAKGIAQLAQVAVNATKTQLDGVKTFASLGGEFVPLAMEQGQSLLDDGSDWQPEVPGDSAKTDSSETRFAEETKPKPLNNTGKTIPAAPADPFEGLKVTKTQKDILDFLLGAGGESRVGIIGDTRAKTIRHLEILEEKGVVKCIVRPERLTWSSETKNLPFEVLNYCGIWKLRKMPSSSFNWYQTKSRNSPVD